MKYNYDVSTEVALLDESQVIIGAVFAPDSNAIPDITRNVKKP